MASGYGRYSPLSISSRATSAPFSSTPCHGANKTFMKPFIKFFDRLFRFDGTGSKGRWDISSRYLDNLPLKKPRFDLFCIRKISSVNISWEMLKLLKIYPLSIFLDYYILIFQTYYFLHKCAT